MSVWFFHMAFAAFLLVTMSGTAETDPTQTGPPNVLLLSVDTLRADRLGCYGYPLPTSPNLDRFANTALIFDDCVCEVPLTSPSMASMLSSRFPRMLGTTRNGLRVRDDIPLVQEQFQAAGYQTFCIQSNWTLKSKLSGLARGFDLYDDNFNQKRWGFIKAERSADEVTRLALDALANRDPERPFFAWIHYSDPHAPYKLHRERNPSDKQVWRLGNVEKVRVKYDSEVAFMDAYIAQLLAALPENTATLFVGDHGESLYEHDYLGHGRRIHQTGIRIPLMFRAPGLTPGRTSVPARGIDIAPTLLGLVGLPKAAGMLGMDLSREVPAPSRIRVIETYGGAVPNLPGAKAVMANAKPMWQGVLAEGWKLITNGRKTELYYLPEDPGEELDRAHDKPERVAELDVLIKQWDRATESGESGEERLDAADLKALEALGYLE